MTAPTLLIMRHGKSDWSLKVGDRTDRGRPLNDRGRRGAKLMGRTLTSLDLEPDLVVASSARRTRRTAELATKAGRWKAPLRLQDELYEGQPADLLTLLRTEIKPATQRLLVVGHEPMCSEVLQILTGARVAFPTAAVARVDLAVRRWSEVAAGTGELAWLLPPRLLTSLRPEA